MRLNDYFNPDNEKLLRDLCVKYYMFLNEYLKEHQEPPPKEMAQKLGLHVDEYSEFLNYVSSGGLEMMDQLRIQDELNTPGAEFIR